MTMAIQRVWGQFRKDDQVVCGGSDGHVLAMVPDLVPPGEVPVALDDNPDEMVTVPTAKLHLLANSPL